MEEIEKSKMVRTKKVSETNVVHQIMTAMAANTIREIVKTANEEGMRRHCFPSEGKWSICVSVLQVIT